MHSSGFALKSSSRYTRITLEWNQFKSELSCKLVTDTYIPANVLFTLNRDMYTAKAGINIVMKILLQVAEYCSEHSCVILPGIYNQGNQ